MFPSYKVNYALVHIAVPYTWIRAWGSLYSGFTVPVVCISQEKQSTYIQFYSWRHFMVIQNSSIKWMNKMYEWPFKIPVSTRRRFDAHTTSITLKRRLMDVKTTSCAYWDVLINLITRNDSQTYLSFYCVHNHGWRCWTW